MAFTLSKDTLRNQISSILNRVVVLSAVASISFVSAAVELNEQATGLSSQEQIDVVLNGKFTQGALLRGQAPVGAKVTLNGEPVQTNKDGKFVVGFEREAPLQQTLAVELDNGKKWQRDITLEKREYNIQRIDGLEQKMVTPPAEVTARIKQDNINVANARSGNTDLDALFTRFEWPAKGAITGVYGSQRILNGVPK